MTRAASTRRSWLLRASVFFNAVLLLYFTAYLSTNDGRSDILEDYGSATQLSGRGLEVERIVTVERLSGYDQPISVENGMDPASAPTGSRDNTQSITMNSQAKTTARLSTTLKTTDMDKKDFLSDGTSSDEPIESNEVTPSLKQVIGCSDRTSEYKIAQKGDFWVLYNYVTPNRTFHCYETITYTTHADYTFLDNLQPLLERWQGPISLAMYTPGSDFLPTLSAIRYLRACGSALVSEYVTFHLFFRNKHVPPSIPKRDKVLDAYVNCSLPAPWLNASATALYKYKKKLLYPVNVGRNIAREAAITHYLLPSDIELYPSPGVITDFLEMVRRQDPPLMRKGPKVFPLAIFEVDARYSPPSNKKELVEMLNNHTAIPFHKKVCPGCHNIPKSKEWISAAQEPGLRVFHVGKRTGFYVHWEPIFIGTHSDPLYEERLSWEGKMDKMTQGYALCVLDYEFQILDNAFLVHKPGIKTLKRDTARAILAGKTNQLIKRVIFPELKVLYGTRKGCAV